MSLPNSLKERTFITVKTDGIQRGLIGEIISRFEKRGLKLVGCKLTVQTPECLEKLYPNEEGWLRNNGTNVIKSKEAKGEDVSDLDPIKIATAVRAKLLKDLVGKPIVAMVWEGANAVQLGRKTVGATNPLEAQIGTIRGDFTVESYDVADSLGHAVRNLVHASGSLDEAAKDIAIYFTEDELVAYDLSAEKILYGEY